VSHITDMVIFMDPEDRDAMARLNEWCAAEDDMRGQQFQPLNADEAGGSKVFCSAVWAMAGNHFPAELLAAALPSFGWRSPTSVTLLVSSEDQLETQIHRADGKSITDPLPRW
jgi:hypothetical protein